MALIPFNVLSTSQLFDIEDNQIIELIPLTSGSTLVFEKLGRIQKIDVEETASTVALNYPSIFPLVCFVSGTSGNVVTRYLSACQCKQVVEFSLFSQIQYDKVGVELETVNAALPADGGITFAALVTLISATSSEFVTIAGAQTVTGAKTFSAALAATSTIAVTGVSTLTGGIVAGSGTQVGSDTPTVSKPSGIVTTAVTATAPQAYKTVVITNTLVTATTKAFVSLGGYGGTGIPVIAQVTTSANTITVLVLNSENTAGANLSAAMNLYFFIVN